jgi:hypothetical protein
MSEAREKPDIGYENAAEPMDRCPEDVLQGMGQLLSSVDTRSEATARGRPRCRRWCPAGIGTSEKAYFDPRPGRYLSHFRQFRVGEHENAAALGDTVNADIEPGCFLHYRVQRRGTLRAWYFDAKSGAIREPLGGLGQVLQVAAREP